MKKNSEGDPITMRTKPTIYHFKSTENYDDLIVLTANLVNPGGYLVMVSTAPDMDKKKI